MKKQWLNEDNQEYIGMIEMNYNVDDTAVLHIVKRGKYIVAGTGTNCGLIFHHRMLIDTMFSDDENLQGMIEIMTENYQNGRDDLVIIK